MNNPRIRKQISELTVEDLEQYSVWEYALDEEGVEGQDEATVRPYAMDEPLKPVPGRFIVRASLTLADGTTLRGYLSPTVDGDSSLRATGPVAVVEAGHVYFWYGVHAPKPAEVAESYARLGKSSASEVFPLRFESDVELDCGPVTGEVPGFVVLEDFRSMRTKVIQ